MVNKTNSSLEYDQYTEYPQIFLTAERIDGLLILIENIIVAVCLFTQRTKFTKKEFWLQIVCLNIHDFFTGVLILITSYLRSSLTNNACTILWLLITVNEMTFSCHIFGICIYRVLFLVKSGKFRFGWTVKTTYIQVILSVVICTIYSCVPLTLSWKGNHELKECSIPELFGSNLQKYGIYMGSGFGLILVCTDVLYSILLYKLNKILKRRRTYCDRTDTSEASSETIRLRRYKGIPASANRHERTTFLVYGGEGRDNQKQGIYLIGAILLWINLSIGAPVSVHFLAINVESIQLSKVFFQLMILIPMNNSFFNPWMYAMQSREFRRAVRENATNIISLLRRQ